MATIKDFDYNEAFEAEMKRTREYKEGLKEVTREAMAAAIVIAPKRTWAYATSFVIVEEEGELRFGNTDFKAHFIEWGTVKMEGQHVLRRAVEMVGIRLDVDHGPKV